MKKAMERVLEHRGAAVRLRCMKAGRDLCLVVSGGHAEHVGAVALAQPRPSRRDPGRISASASVLAVPGHQEDQLARELALKIAGALNVTVCVCCGIHLEDADAAAIEEAVRAARLLADELIAAESAGTDMCRQSNEIQ